MGGRGTSGSRNAVDTATPRRMKRSEAEELLNIDNFPSTELEGGLSPTKYSTELFRYYYRISRDHVKSGKEPNAWSNFFVNDDSPSLSKRAARGVQTLIDKEKANIRLDVELGVFSVDEGRDRLAALGMVQRTYNNAVKRYEKELW